jgi:transcriptional regulator with XRE-family HTH domain
MDKIKMKQLGLTIGKAIARHRIACGLTQGDVAEKLGIGNEAVSRIERGLVMPTIARLAQLAEIFNCPTGDLLTEVSTSSRDRLGCLRGKLERLDEIDRVLILEIVETLTNRLQNCR